MLIIRGTFRLMTAMCEMQCNDCKGTIVPGNEFWLCVEQTLEGAPDPLGIGGEYVGRAKTRHCTDCVADEE
jgi:hypothetical protein